MRIRKSMQMPTMKEAVIRAYVKRDVIAKIYLEEILFDVSEDFCILFEFLLLRTALPLVFVVN